MSNVGRPSAGDTFEPLRNFLVCDRGGGVIDATENGVFSSAKMWVSRCVSTAGLYHDGYRA